MSGTKLSARLWQGIIMGAIPKMTQRNAPVVAARHLPINYLRKAAQSVAG